jgi:hypothetical protein
LANGDQLVIPPITDFPTASLTERKRQKRGRKHGENLRRANGAKLEAKMKRKKTKRKQQDCDVAKVIDTVEQAVSTAKKVYRTVEPMVRAIIANRRKPK